MIKKTPLAVQNIHAMDDEEQLLQQRLEDDASHEAIIAATPRRAQIRSRTVPAEATKAKLRQKRSVADCDFFSQTSVVPRLRTGHWRRPRNRPAGPGPRREPSPSSPDL